MRLLLPFSLSGFAPPLSPSLFCTGHSGLEESSSQLPNATQSVLSSGTITNRRSRDSLQLNVHLFVFQHGPGQTQAVHQRVGGSETGFCFTTAKETTRSILKRCSSGHPVSKSIEPLHETSGMDAYGFRGNGGALRPEFREALDLVINTFSERVGCQVASPTTFYILSLYYATQF